MQQPLTPLALAALAGIGLAKFTQPPLALLLVIGFISILTLLFHPRTRPFSLLVLASTTAAIRFVECFWMPPLDDIQRAIPTLPAIATIRGHLAAPPIQHASHFKDSLRIHTTALIDLTELKDGDRWVPCSGTVQARMPGALPPHFFQSQHVELDGVLTLPSTSDAPGLFDPAAYLRLNQIHRLLVTEGLPDWHLGPQASTIPPLSDRFLTWGRQVLARGLPNPDPTVELIWAMTLGWHPASGQDAAQSFLQSGTIHVFAISGLHIALICMVFVAVLRLLRLPRALCGLLALPAAWAYVAATGWQSSAIRSAFMMTVIIGGWALQRPGHLLNSLAGACLGVLAWQPGQLFLVGFQLSFGVVGSMAILGPPLHQLWTRQTLPDPLIPLELRPPLWHRARIVLEWLGLNLSSSTAAWLGSCPLVWHYFHLFNPVSLVANLLVIPLSSGALVAALASLACGDWLPALGEVFNASAWVWMTAMVRSSDAFASIPNGWWHVAPIPIFLWIPYYGLLFLAASGTQLSPVWKRIRIAGLLAWISSAALWKSLENSKTRMVCLPGGGAVWIDLPGVAQDGLLNGGSDSATRRITIPYLQAHGIDQISHWFITQAHVQYLGGSPQIQETLQPRTVSALPALKSTLESRKRPKLGSRDIRTIQWLPPGSEWLGWKILHPPIPHDFRGFDDISGVLIGDFGGVRILFCGNLGRRGQRALAECLGESLRADIVMTGIPNDGEPLINALLDQVQPQMILLLDAQYPVGRRIKLEILERLESQGYSWMSLSQAGTLTLEAAGGTWQIEAHKTGERRTGTSSAVLPRAVQGELEAKSTRLK